LGLSFLQIYNEFASDLQLRFFLGEEFAAENEVGDKKINVLGLELVGFIKGLKDGQIQVIDSCGVDFIGGSPEKARESLAALFSFNIPAVIFTENNNPDQVFLQLCEANRIPVLVTGLDRWEFVRRIEHYLETAFAPKIDYRGTMMEVFGVGVLISGKSNVGKSECAIDLLQRGHRLIGDDIVEITRKDCVLLAQGKYPISHRMELRGVGIIDIVKLMGISAVKDIEKVELIVELEKWDPGKSYERLGLEEKKREILGIDIPYVQIPVAPGRNIAILVEVSAMNHRLRKKGIIAARELEEEVLRSFSKNTDGED